MKLILGIDPGLDGGCAMLSEPRAYVWGTPTVTEMLSSGKSRRTIDAATIATELRCGMIDGCNAEAWIERVSASPQMGVCSAFNFGEGLGVWLGVLAAAGIPVRWVAPNKWKRAVGIQPGADKETSRALALQLFPYLAEDLKRKCDHGKAEALLIGHYGRDCHVPRS